MNWNDIYFELRCALPRNAAEIITRALITEHNRAEELTREYAAQACYEHFKRIDKNIRETIIARTTSWYHNSTFRMGACPIQKISFIDPCITPEGAPVGIYKDTDSIFTTQKMAAAFLPYMLQKYTARDLTGSVEIPPEMLGVLPLRGRSSFNETSTQAPRKLRAADLGQPTRRQKIKAKRSRG